jgi:hypothetical protein
MATYRAFYVDHKGNEKIWTGLRRTQATWRDAWCMRNALALDLKRWGWSREA